MSFYFDHFQLGAVFETRGRTITETDVVLFAGLSGDFVELHINEEYARRSKHGRRIAHGALVFSISTGLMTQMNWINDTVIAFYGLDRLRFTNPVFIGDTLHVAKKVVDTERKEQGGVVVFETTVMNQRGETVLVYTDRLMIAYGGLEEIESGQEAL